MSRWSCMYVSITYTDTLGVTMETTRRLKWYMLLLWFSSLPDLSMHRREHSGVVKGKTEVQIRAEPAQYSHVNSRQGLNSHWYASCTSIQSTTKNHKTNLNRQLHREKWTASALVQEEHHKLYCTTWQCRNTRHTCVPFPSTLMTLQAVSSAFWLVVHVNCVSPSTRE